MRPSCAILSCLAFASVVSAEVIPGDILVADPSAFGGALLRVDPISGSRTVVSSLGDFSNPWDVAIGPAGQLYVVDDDAFGGTGAVFEIDPATGGQTVIASGGGFLNPRGITVYPIPEPSTAMLLVLGAVSLTTKRRRTQEARVRPDRDPGRGTDSEAVGLVQWTLRPASRSVQP